MSALDPDAVRMLAFGAGRGGKPFEDGTPEEARAAQNAAFPLLRGALEPVAETQERRIDGPRGAIGLRIHRGVGAPREGAPALLYLHGGGWVTGSPEAYDDVCRWFANRADAVVVCPDYRLAPEHRFPAGLEDCAATLRFMAEAEGQLGIDRSRIAVAGDSAGGNLAAVLALMSRDGDAPPLVCQLLVYPNTDAAAEADSYRRFAEGFGLTAHAMRWMRAHYLGDGAGFGDWRVSPLRASTLAGAPPAFVALAGFDILADEGEAYAAKLGADGVPVRIERRPGQIHGYLSAGRFTAAALETVGEAVAAWRFFESRRADPA